MHSKKGKGSKPATSQEIEQQTVKAKENHDEALKQCSHVALKIYHAIARRVFGKVKFPFYESVCAHRFLDICKVSVTRRQ